MHIYIYIFIHLYAYVYMYVRCMYVYQAAEAEARREIAEAEAAEAEYHREEAEAVAAEEYAHRMLAAADVAEEVNPHLFRIRVMINVRVLNHWVSISAYLMLGCSVGQVPGWFCHTWSTCGFDSRARASDTRTDKLCGALECSQGGGESRACHPQGQGDARRHQRTRCCRQGTCGCRAGR